MTCTDYEDLVGKRLQHDILDNRGVMLIPSGTILTEVHTQKLHQFDISLFDIHVEALKPAEEEAVPARSPSSFSEPILSASELAAAEAIKVAASPVSAPPAPAETKAGAWVKRTEEKFKEIESYIHKNGKVPVADVEQHVLPAIMAAAQQHNIYKLFGELKAEGDYRYNHSIGVAMIAATIGRWLKLDADEMKLLATGASLCDIGTVRLPSELLHKKTALQPHEQEIYKQHTKIGHDLLIESGLDPRVALIALQHHERNDGSGYPNRLKGEQIDPLSKIVALADLYLAMTSDRPYRKALPFYQVIQDLNEEIRRGRIDSHIGLTFLNRLMAAQVGNQVVLEDGRRGTIMLTHANYPTRPLISVGDTFIDLAKHGEIRMVEILG